MLHSLSEVRGYDISASDGEIGHLSDAFFDDRTWTLRYFVVDTGKWIFGRKVLIAPECALKPDPQQKDLPVAMTRESIKDSPDVKCDLPVSRQDEVRVREYHNWPRYWEFFAPVGTVGGMITPPLERPVQPEPHPEAVNQGDPDLRSMKEVIGYAVEGSDGDIGTVSDLIADDDGWCIPYLAVDLAGSDEKVLIPAASVKEVGELDKKIWAWIDKAAVADSPRYRPGEPISEAQERGFMEYYGLERAPEATPRQAAGGRP